jgi:hypothetical protein
VQPDIIKKKMDTNTLKSLRIVCAVGQTEKMKKQDLRARFLIEKNISLNREKELAVDEKEKEVDFWLEMFTIASFVIQDNNSEEEFNDLLEQNGLRPYFTGNY